MKFLPSCLISPRMMFRDISEIWSMGDHVFLLLLKCRNNWLIKSNNLSHFLSLMGSGDDVIEIKKVTMGSTAATKPTVSKAVRAQWGSERTSSLRSCSMLFECWSKERTAVAPQRSFRPTSRSELSESCEREGLTYLWIFFFNHRNDFWDIHHFLSLIVIPHNKPLF